MLKMLKTDAKNQKTEIYYVLIQPQTSYLLQINLSSHTLPTHTNTHTYDALHCDSK